MLSMKAKNILLLAAAVIICQLAGVIGSVFTAPSIPTWYAGLNKPFFNPPSWVFGPAWITLYTLMGLALYKVYSLGWKKEKVKIALAFFGVQLVLNAFWSIIFFGWQNPYLAFIEIIVLWLFIALTTKKFWQLSRKAGYLMLPYLLWVSFAAILNFFIWQLN
jgi:tryptophan-rich sensory protein